MEMKCVCGYEYETVETYTGRTETEIYREVVKGDKPFIRLTPIPDKGYESIDYIYVQYACPKCGTVKVNI